MECCGTCAKEVDEHCIGCDKCEVWVHGNEMCSGLPQNVIDVILEYSGEGIHYMCMKCRVHRASGTGQCSSPTSRSDNFMAETLGQLFQHLRGMSSIITNLAKEVKALSQKQATPENLQTQDPDPFQPHPQPQPQPAMPRLDAPIPNHPQNTAGAKSPDQYRLIVRQELREMHERDKRRDSVIIRGLKATTPRGLVTEFADVTQRVMGTKVELSDVVIIPGHGGICRAKILNPSEKKLVLDQAKDLRNTEYKHVYIRRDLTYAQRGELKRRREAEAARNSEGESRVPCSENRETIPKTVFSNDEMPLATTEGSSVAPPSLGPVQGTAKPRAPAPTPTPEPHAQTEDPSN